ncbi:MAG: VWA domain-containing protein [Myxococcales bacterium]|nr:MAG: VWA domain-containing protein [Myxococcales bacterium]
MKFHLIFFTCATFLWHCGVDPNNAPEGGQIGDHCEEGSCAVDLKCGVASMECMLMESCVDSTGAAFEDNCRSGQNCVTDKTSDQFGTCIPGEDCNNEFAPERLPPNVIIVLDRSGSMDETIGGQTKWDIAKGTVNQIVTNFGADIRFGLAPFSSCVNGQACSAGQIAVDVADSNSDIVTFLDSKDIDYLCQSGVDETSLGTTMDSLGNDSSWIQDGREHALLVITDGVDNCGNSGPTVATTLLASDPSIRTFTVGFSGDVNSLDMNTLDSIAANGGTGDAYEANSANALEQALGEIAASAALTCTFTLKDNIPGANSQLYVYFDDSYDEVAENASDGWTYDAETTTVTFHGPACDQIKDGTVQSVSISYYCPRGVF